VRTDRHVLVAAQDAELTASVGRAVQGLGALTLELARPDAAAGLWPKAARAAVMVLEVDPRANGATTLVRRLAASVRDGRLIVAARDAAADQVRALFRAGAADVLTGPFTHSLLAASLSELLHGGPELAQAQGEVVSVLKAGGGAGATTLALNLAALGARGDEKRRRDPRSTAILDLDLQFGDADLALDLKPRSTLVDVLQASERVDPRFLESVMTEHSSGLRLLAAPPALTPLDAMTADFAAEIVDHAARGFQRVFVDLPDAWTDWTFSVLGRSSIVLLVVPATVAGAVRARRVLEGLKAAGVQTPVFLAINGLHGLLEALERPSRIGRNLETPVDAALRFDPAAPKAADRGELVVEAFPKGPLAKDLGACLLKLDARLEALGADAAFSELAA